MATLQNIRKRGPLVALVIGFALLAFILGDLLSSGSSLLSNDQFEMAEIAGESVDYREYQSIMNEAIEIYELRSGGASVDDQTQRQFRNQAWQEIVNRYVLEKEYEKLGLAVHPEELFDLVQGNNIHPLVKQAFGGQQGQFNPQMVIQFLKNMDRDTSGTSKKMWLYIEEQVEKDRLFSKYNALVTKGLYTTTKEAQMAYKENSKLVDFQYVVQPYKSIEDQEVTVSEADLKKYYEEHKNEYKIPEESRDVAYVSFDVEPTADDVNALLDEMREIKNDFALTADNQSFVNAESNQRFDPRHYKQGELPELYDSLMFSAEIGYIYGPYRDEGMFKLAKLDTVRFLPDSVKARHILIQPTQNQTQEQAEARIDSLKQAIEAGADFAQLATQHSADQASATKGGDLGWITEGQMVKPFNDTCFTAQPGELKKVYTQFGIHLVQVTQRSEPVKKARVATITRPITPSKQTRDSVYAEAVKFASKNNTGAKFEQAITDNELTKKLAPNLRANDERISGLQNPRAFVRAVFKTEAGQIIQDEKKNPIFELGDRYVIGVVSVVRQKGIAPFELVRNDIEVEVRKQKKAEKIIADWQGKLSSGLEAIAQQAGGEVKQAENIKFSSFQIPGAGIEPKVIATATTMQKDELSKPIAGEMGVYVIKVTSITSPPQKEDFAPEKQSISRNLAQRASYQVFNALKELADIKDYRSKFF